MVQYNNERCLTDEQFTLIQPDASIISNIATINEEVSAASNAYEWTIIGTREYGIDSDFGKLAEHNVQLPTPPRSEDSSSLSVSPRGEAAAQAFAYDGMFHSGVSQPNFTDYSLHPNGVFDYGPCDFTAQHYASYCAPSEYLIYEPMNDVVYPEQYGAPASVECAPQHADVINCNQVPSRMTLKRPSLVDDAAQHAAVALLSKHVSVTNGSCTYVVRICPGDVGRFIGAWGSRIRNLQWQTRTTVTVRYANAFSQPSASSVDAQPSPVDEAEQAQTESQKTPASSPLGDQQGASIPVEVSGPCACVMHALREIYFRFPFSDFGPIDIPNIVKAELRARASARAAAIYQHNTSGAQQQLAANNGSSKEVAGNSAQVASNAEKPLGVSAKQRKRKMKALAKRAAAAQQEACDRASPNSLSNGSVNEPSTTQQAADVAEVKQSATTSNGKNPVTSGMSYKDRKPLLFSEFIMQKVAAEKGSVKSAPAAANNSSNFNRSESSNSKNQNLNSASRLAPKKKSDEIDIESMKDFPPLAGAPVSGNTEAEATSSESQTQSTANDAIDGASIEQATREFSALTVNSDTITAVQAPNQESAEWSSMGTDGSMPAENGYVAVASDSTQFGSTSAYAYTNPDMYGYYPVDFAAYQACPGYYPAEFGDYYTAAAQPYLAYVQQNDAYPESVQYSADGSIAGYSVVPSPALLASGWAADGSYVQGAYPAVNQFSSQPFGVHYDGYESVRAYDSSCAYQVNQAAAQWYADHSVANVQSQQPDSVRNVNEAAPAGYTQPTGVLLPCRVSAVSMSSDDDAGALEVHVQLLAPTDAGLANRADAFVESLVSFYSDAESLAAHRYTVASEIADGSILAVRLADSKWHRAEVLSRTEDQLRVFLVDVGNSLELAFSADSFAQLPEAFKLTSVAPLAMRCRVRSTRLLRSTELNANDALALLKEGAQRPVPLAAYVRLSPQDNAADTCSSTITKTPVDADLFVDDFVSESLQ